MRRSTVTVETHVLHLETWGRRDAVRLVCTCNQSHGARTWPTFESAMSGGEFDFYVPLWRDNPDVTRICRDYAAQA